MDPKTDGPEKFSHEWYLQQLRGMSHLQRLLAVNQDDHGEHITELMRRVTELETERTEMLAKIGEFDSWMREMERLRQERLRSNGTASPSGQRA